MSLFFYDLSVSSAATAAPAARSGISFTRVGDESSASLRPREVLACRGSCDLLLPATTHVFQLTFEGTAAICWF